MNSASHYWDVHFPPPWAYTFDFQTECGQNHHFFCFWWNLPGILRIKKAISATSPLCWLEKEGSQSRHESGGRFSRQWQISLRLFLLSNNTGPIYFHKSPVGELIVFGNFIKSPQNKNLFTITLTCCKETGHHWAPLFSNGLKDARWQLCSKRVNTTELVEGFTLAKRWQLTHGTKEGMQLHSVFLFCFLFF